MNRIKITNDLSFSRIVYGMWRLGDDSDTSVAHVQAKIEACLAQGITTMDQADIYGGYAAEEVLGNALKAAPALNRAGPILKHQIACGVLFKNRQPEQPSGDT